MDNMTDQNLPSCFDLYFDIKSRDELVRQYAALKSELASMDRVMASHGMEFTEDELSIINPDSDPEPTTAAPVMKR
jgi:hypothetical protein